MKRRLKSLRARLVLYVFSCMTISSLVTMLVYFLIRQTGWVRPFIITRLMSPIWMVCISSFFGTLVAGWFCKYYLGPIIQLSQAAKLVAKGDFTVRLPEESQDEMNELIHSFNSMTKDLGSIEMFRTDFINSFSHEFKTPIVSIRGFARQLQRDDLTEEQRREYATIIADESQRLVDLATKILMLSKLDNQQIVTEKSDFRLDEQLRTCILLMEKQWSSKKLSLDIELEDVQCRANAEMLSQAWVNLLSNAIKFTPAGGSIGIYLRKEDNSAIVQIRDSGIGMSKDVQAHIFEKFYQGDASHYPEGNGLGLPMVKRIIDLSDGTIQVESEEGKGSTFTITLPT